MFGHFFLYLALLLLILELTIIDMSNNYNDLEIEKVKFSSLSTIQTIGKSILLTIIFFLVVDTIIVSAQMGIEKPYHDGIVILKLKPEFKYLAKDKVDFGSIFQASLLKSLEFNIEREFPNSDAPENLKNKYGVKNIDISGICRLSFNADEDVLQVISELNKMEYFEYVEPLYKTELLYVPNDPLNQTSQYWLNSIRAFDAWNISQGDTNIVIGISDTGIELAHPELIYQIKYNYADMPDGIDNDLDGFVDNFRGWNFGENNANVQADASYHGAWVSGIAGAATDNGVGLSGAGFKCKLLPLKIMNSDGIIENAFQSIAYAAEHGCDVVNCSWGSSYFQQMAQDVVNYATINYDLLIVSAAGNTNTDIKYFPSSYENVLSVAGTQMDDEKWNPDNSISNQGSSYSHYVDVCAPATNFYTVDLNEGYVLVYGGTSFASPIVAGCAGILRSYFPDYNANQIAELIKISADNIDTIPYNLPYAGKLGHGRMNLFNALTMVQTPSILFEYFNVVESDGVVTINGSFTNYLADALNLNISIELLSSYADLPNTEVYSGNLSGMGTHISENQIIVVENENIPHDYKIVLKFIYTADNYSGEQIIEFYVNPGYQNISTDNLQLSIASSGRIGFSDVSSAIGDGFLLNDAYSLLYDCGIISGFSATELYSSVRQASDFGTVNYPMFVEVPENSDFQISTEFTDINDVSPKGIRILEDAYSWAGVDNKDFIIVDYQIINESDYDFTNFYFGLFTDWDLVDAAVNTVVFDNANSFMYAQSESSQTMFAGIKLLSKQVVKNYALAQVGGGDGVIDISDGFLDIEKFYMISNSNTGYFGEPTDVVVYSGAGPFNILTGDTIVVGFAFIAAESLYYINNALTQSAQKYDDILHPQSVENNFATSFNVFPNPAQDILTVRPENISFDEYNLEIFNSFGDLVVSNKYTGESKINISYLSDGIYLLKIQIADKIFVKKITKLN